MTFDKLKISAVLVLSTALAITASIPIRADDTGFTLEDTIRNQIFQELKSNVEDLYQNSRLLLPNVDTSLTARITRNDAGNGFTLPVESDVDSASKNRAVE